MLYLPSHASPQLTLSTPRQPPVLSHFFSSSLILQPSFRLVDINLIIACILFASRAPSALARLLKPYSSLGKCEAWTPSVAKTRAMSRAWLLRFADPRARCRTAHDAIESRGA